MLDKPRCYVANAQAHTEAGRFYHEKVLLPTLEQVVNPVDTLHVLANWEEARSGFEIPIGPAEASVSAIQSCRYLVGVFDGPRVDSGVAAELGFALASGLSCFGLMTDRRVSGEGGLTLNPLLWSLVIASGGSIAGSLSTLIEILDGELPHPPPRWLVNS